MRVASSKIFMRLRFRTVLASAVVLAVMCGLLSVSAPASAWVQAPSATYACPLPMTVSTAVVFDSNVPEDYRAAMRAAMQDWNNSGVPFAFVDRTDNFQGGPFIRFAYADTSPDVAAFADTRSTSACWLNTLPKITAYWMTMGPLSSYDRERILVHELGHVLGLDHTFSFGCTASMVTYVIPLTCTGNPGPYADDVAGVLARFAPNRTEGFPANSNISYNASGGQVSLAPTGWDALDMADVPEWTAATDNDRYKWTFVRKPGSEWGKVVNTATGLCLVASGAGRGEGMVSQDACGSSGVLWSLSITQGSAGTQLVQLYNAATSRCLGYVASWFWNASASTLPCSDNRTDLVVGTATPSGGMKHDEMRSLPDIGHEIVGQGSGRCLNVVGGVATAGNGVEIRDCAGAVSQQFNFHHDTATLTAFDPLPGQGGGDSLSPALCVTTSGTGNNSAVAVNKCVGSAGQQWRFLGNGNILNPGSGRCLAVRNADTDNGAALLLYDCNSGGNEVFNVLSGIRPGSTIRTAVGGGKALTASSGSGVAHSDTADGSQQWSFFAAPGQSYGLLVNTGTTQCLNAPGSDSATTVVGCNPNSASQRWTPVVNSDGTIKLTVSSTGQCADLFSSNTAENSPVGTWGCSGATNQRFRVLENTTAPPSAEPVAPSGAPNLASFGTVSQSSDYASTTGAGLAIDGNNDGDFSHGSVTHTSPQASAWWQVDLGRDTDVDILTVSNRTDCCADRLAKFWVFTSSQPFDTRLSPTSQDNQTTVTGTYFDGTASATSTYHFTRGGGVQPSCSSGCATARFRYLMIQLTRNDPLSLAEVRLSASPDLALKATATASSSYNTAYAPAKVADGISGQDNNGEWASLNELNPWVRLDWDGSQTVNTVTFFDRPISVAWARGGTLSFSDGSALPVTGIPNDGTPYTVAFPDRTVTWVKFEVSGGTGANVGLSELQVFDTDRDLAFTAKASASTEYDNRYRAANAADGIVGFTGVGEWSSLHQLNPWLRLDWTTGQTVNTLVLRDRANTVAWAKGGTVTFSDGSSLVITGIPDDGRPYTVNFGDKTISWLSFQVADGSGDNVGLDELQVFHH